VVAVSVPVAVAPAAAAAPKTEAAPVAKGPKPVKFDKTIAAKGVTILFGSESGNAEGLADMVKGKLQKDGHPVQVLDAAVVDGRQLKAFANLLVLTSTWGEGDPPSNAIELVADLKNKALGLSTAGIQFSVLSLGDTNYEYFCQCGKDFDQYLEQYGGKRLFKRVDCDIAYEAPFEEWLTGVQAALKAGLNTTVEYVEEPTLVTV
jgi:sulfite reductase (NADPH) flavoprotein alpha-component